MSRAPKPGHVFIEVGTGVAGPHLSVGDHQTSFRLAGPKPWGGSRTIHQFQVDIAELRAQLDEFEARARRREDGGDDDDDR